MFTRRGFVASLIAAVAARRLPRVEHDASTFDPAEFNGLVVHGNPQPMTATEALFLRQPHTVRSGLPAVQWRPLNKSVVEVLRQENKLLNDLPWRNA